MNLFPLSRINRCHGLHRKLALVATLALIMAVTVTPVALAASRANDTFHTDHRNTPKLQFEPQWDAPGGLSRDGVADAFVAMAGEQYQLPSEREDLVFLEMKESLLGRHYVYHQHLHGIPVEGAHFIVSVSKQDSRVYRTYNNTYPVSLPPDAPLGVLSEDQAYEQAWQTLRGHGELISPPQNRLVYLPVGDTFVLSYIVDLELDAPYGGWRVTMDGSDGAVSLIEDSRLIRKKLPGAPTIEERLAEYTGQATDRRAAFSRQEVKNSDLEEAMARKGSRAQGTGLVFDPDPRTTLQNNYIQDYSSSSVFTDAYFTRDLLDIQLSGGRYYLNGPWVYIANWDPPATAPSNTNDGNWTATRGNNAFNDAMTYFHLDQNQRYIQSLGFTGSSGIQEGSILADSDGVNGQDNSYYQPAANRLSFGHGCVDDNEDADVIIHEYGHAIQHSIAYWAGGDTGGMGEGFSDYWGGSYSYSTENGPLFYPNWIYTWDGHGASNHCWPGRVMNATGAQYVHTTYYGAHEMIPGGYQSDELWSTPLFQTMLALTDQGYAREEVDQIILESHFGIGSGPKMRDLANATIGVAELLQPDGPHAEVFFDKFLVHNIVEIPVVDLKVNTLTITSESGTNGAADPGESIEFTLEIRNDGNVDATGVTAVLSTEDPLVNITQDTSTFDDLVVDGNAVSANPFALSIDPAFQCGDPVNLTLTFTFDGLADTTLDFFINTGAPNPILAINEDNLSIPDANVTGVTSYIEVSGTDAVISGNFSIDVRVIHQNIGDLRLIMISPSGTHVWLHNMTGGTTNTIIGNYPGTLDPFQPLDVLLGEPLDGTWQLKLLDLASGYSGFLDLWALNEIGSFECEDAVVAVGDDLMPTRFAVSQNHPNPFNPQTTISFSVPENAGVVNLAVFDISGRLVRTLAHDSFGAGHYSRVWDGRDSAGRTVSSGTYFYRLSGKGFSEARKMILMK